MWPLLAAILTLFNACQPTSPRPVAPAFYHWKSHFAWDSTAASAARRWGFRQLYVRCFDVGRDGAGRPIPVGEVSTDWTAVPDSVAIVPTIFVVPQVFSGLTDSTAVVLAEQVAAKIQRAMTGRAFSAFQIDCDWTPSTQGRYFIFLQKIQTALAPARLSVTLRLWQLKNRKEVGIPPADRVMLMPYNLHSPAKVGAGNSILNPAEARTYLVGNKPYPLPMDVALPAFSWGVHFRGAEMQGFLQKFSTEIADEQLFLTRESGDWYAVRGDTVWQGQYLRPGDRIRAEYAAPEAVLEARDLALKLCPNDTVTLSVYHLDDFILAQQKNCNAIDQYFFKNRP